MAAADVNQETVSVLKAAISKGRLPADIRPTAEKLVTRLQSVTRVSIMGRAQSGKSTIAKLLAGAEVGLEQLGSAPLRMEYGDEAKVIATLSDGSTVEGPGVDDLSEIAELDPALVTLKIPLAALKKISLLELRVSEDHGEAVKALNWALKHTDIAIWCTEYFTGDEQGLWSSMPDVIKDHAMLLRTKADTLSEPWDIAEDRLRGSVRSEFAHVFAVAAEQGVAARDAGGLVDKAAMKKSGSTKVISTILRELESTKRATADQADMLLRKHGVVSDEAKQPPVKAVEAPAPAKAPEPAPKAKTAEPAKEAAPKPQAAQTAKPQPAAPKPQASDSPKPAPAAGKSSVQDKLKAVVKPVPEKTAAKGTPKSKIAAATAKAKADATPAPKPPKPALVPVEPAKQAKPPAEGLDDAARKALVDASNRLRDTGLRLTQGEVPSPKAVLTQSIEAVDYVSDRLASLNGASHPSVTRAVEAAGYAADILNLQKAEDKECDMVETVSLLLQVKRGIDADLAGGKGGTS